MADATAAARAHRVRHIRHAGTAAFRALTPPVTALRPHDAAVRPPARRHTAGHPQYAVPVHITEVPGTPAQSAAASAALPPDLRQTHPHAGNPTAPAARPVLHLHPEVSPTAVRARHRVLQVPMAVPAHQAVPTAEALHMAEAHPTAAAAVRAVAVRPTAAAVRATAAADADKSGPDIKNIIFTKQI